MIKHLWLKFITDEPELAKILLSCRTVETKKIKTAGVSITKQPNLYYNPEFMEALTENEQIAVLKHEMYHLLNLHPARSKEKHHEKFNIAADLAINQYIDNLPEGSLDVKKTKYLDPKTGKPAQLSQVLAEKRHAEYYYEHLPVQEVNVSQNGKARLQDHAQWDETADETASRQVMEDICDATGFDLDKVKGLSEEEKEEIKSYGVGATDINKHLEQPKTYRKVNWNEILKNVKQQIKKRIKAKTVYRFNKRYPDMPGKARNKFTHKQGKKEVRKLYAAVDVSLSIDDNTCREFLQNCKILEPLVQDFEIIQCSDRIHDVKVVKRNGKTVAPIKFVRKGTGGTSFVPVFDHIKRQRDPKNKEDIFLVYLTDLYGDFPDDNDDVHTIWINSEPHRPSYNPKVPFGELYYLK